VWGGGGWRLGDVHYDWMRQATSYDKNGGSIKKKDKMRAHPQLRRTTGNGGTTSLSGTIKSKCVQDLKLLPSRAVSSPPSEKELPTTSTHNGV